MTKLKLYIVMIMVALTITFTISALILDNKTKEVLYDYATGPEQLFYEQQQIQYIGTSNNIKSQEKLNTENTVSIQQTTGNSNQAIPRPTPIAPPKIVTRAS